MEFRFRCFVVRHVSDRVTVTPLEHPSLAVHATSLERATEELTLAIDDRIARAHPRRLAEYARSSAGELIELEVAALPVWSEGEVLTRAMVVTAVVAPAHKPFVEVRVPRLDLRLWLQAGDDLSARAAHLVREHLLTLPEERRLALRREAPEALTALVLDATPTKLASLKRSELDLPERAPPRPADEDEEARSPDEDEAAKERAREDDDWFEKGTGKRTGSKAKGAEKKKPRPATPTLRAIGVPLHELARAGTLDRAFEVDALVERLLARLDGDAPEPILLVGPAGVGKTALIHELANRMAESVDEKRRERAFFHADGSRLIAGQGFYGDWQRQTLEAVAEARRARAIVDFGHVVELLDAGRSAHSDQNTAQLLGPVLGAREVTAIGEATPEEWVRIEQRNQGFARAWSVVRLEEPAPALVAKILARVAGELGEASGVRIEPGAVAQATGLARRFWPYGSVLGNTVAFLRRLVDARAHARAARVDAVDAIAQFSSESGIPTVLLRDDVALDPERVRAFLRERVMGQDGAVDRVVEVVSVIKAGLADLRRPVAVLVFAGPTGVGKTELSKALAEFVFGSRERMVRLDMGEYAGPDALARLLGEPRAPGHLTSAVRRQPFSVVLFDEIEKAHPAVFDALLGVLGEGRLTDADGRFTDFRNAVIVMTSNLGADTIKARVGFGGSTDGADRARAARQHYVAEAQRFFRPELFNRIDDFVVFGALGEEAIRAIVEREVGHVKTREGLRRHGVALEVNGAALDVLAARGFDPRYGARPLKRAIERELVVPIGEYLAEHPRHGLGAVELSVDRDERAGLAMRARTLGSDDDARAEALAALKAAAQLRAEVRRWTRSALCEELRRRVSYFDRASRSPAFWKEHGVAEQESQRASVARELLGALAAVAHQAEAAEDLAFEAYYTRSSSGARSLFVELEALARTFAPMRERLYATMYPARGGVVLYVTAARGAASWLPWFIDSYARWAARRGFTSQVYAARFVPPALRDPPHSKDPRAEWTWQLGDATPSDAPASFASAVAIEGGPATTLLAAEHGAHRIHDGSATQLVRVRFEPVRVRNRTSLFAAHALPASMPNAEIRRISPSKSTVRDLRTGHDHPMLPSLLELEPVLNDWMNWRVFRDEAEPWT